MLKIEKDNLKKTSCICLPHDWLSWRLTGSKDINDIFTDRSDASGTGYFNCQINKYDKELIRLIRLEVKILFYKVVASNEQASKTIFDGNELILGAGCGDNAGAALGMQLQSGQVVISIGTSKVVSLVAEKTATKDRSGYVASLLMLQVNI